jgi:hypothetical protein
MTASKRGGYVCDVEQSILAIEKLAAGVIRKKIKKIKKFLINDREARFVDRVREQRVNG